MADFDLSALAEAIYGGVPAQPADLRAVLAHLGLGAPLWVAAVYTGRGRSLRALAPDADNVRVLDPHPGLAYVLAQRREPLLAALAESGLPHGQPRACAQADQLVGAIQQAVIALRSVELRDPAAGREHRVPLAVELQTRRLALHRLRTGAPDADDAVELWLGLVLSRHRRHLNTIRRKLIEFYALLTRQADRGAPASNAFTRGVLGVVQSFALTDAAAEFRRGLAALRPLLVEQPAPAAVASPAVSRALDYMEGNFHEPITPADAAAAAGCHPAYLSRRFRRELGRTPTQHLHALRVARAQELLGRGDASVLAVALDCGFTSVEHFHRVFKKICGQTPAAFRAEAG